MGMLKGVLVLLLFMMLGDWCSTLMHGFIPGNVLGMLLLFIALSFHWVNVDDVRPIANFLTRNMILFFVPASIGLMDQIGLIAHFWAGFLAICFITTLLVVICVGWLQQLQIRRKEAKDAH